MPPNSVVVSLFTIPPGHSCPVTGVEIGRGSGAANDRLSKVMAIMTRQRMRRARVVSADVKLTRVADVKLTHL